MSESAKTIIKYFCDRFLDLNYYPDSIKAILDLEINNFKNIQKDEILKFTKYGINTIRDVCNVDNSTYEKLIKKSFIDKTTLNNTIIAASLIADAWNKRKLYLKKPKMKIVVAGLDFAGKTSLINRLINDYNYNDIINLEPTIGAVIEEYKSNRLDLVVWDLGGQKDSVKEYLESPEKFFIQVDVLIFVFDSQDDVRYEDALKYLKDITEILTFLNENPYFLILLNKSDSDVVNNPDYQIKFEYLRDKISNVLSNSEKSWKIEIIPTSIYNYYSKEPEIARAIKNIFSKEKMESKIEESEIEKTLQRILDISLKLMDKVVSELSDLKHVLFKIAPSNLLHSLYKVPFEQIPINYESDSKKTSKKDKGKYKKEKKKPKVTLGPPKRIPITPTSNNVKVKENQNKKITEDKIKKIKFSLKPPTQYSDIPMAPSLTVQKPVINLDSLKPPPPPKTTLTPKLSSEGSRAEIIMELKEIFKKKGLTIH